MSSPICPLRSASPSVALCLFARIVLKPPIPSLGRSQTTPPHSLPSQNCCDSTKKTNQRRLISEPLVSSRPPAPAWPGLGLREKGLPSAPRQPYRAASSRQPWLFLPQPRSQAPSQATGSQIEPTESAPMVARSLLSIAVPTARSVGVGLLCSMGQREAVAAHKRHNRIVFWPGPTTYTGTWVY